MISETASLLMAPLSGWHLSGVGVVILLVLLLLCIPSWFMSGSSAGSGPPQLAETIPLLSNSIEFVTNTEKFWNRALETMRLLNTEILRFRLGWRQVYLVVGEKKTNPLFRVNTGLTSHYFFTLLTDVLFGPTKKDMARLAADITGRGMEPIPGTEHIEDRLWLKWHHIFANELMPTKSTNNLAAWFFSRFIARASELFPLNEPTEVLVWQFLQRHQTECAGRALCGDLVFDMNPGYLEALAEFEVAIMPVAFGPPRWLYPKPHRARDRWLEVNRRHMATALRNYDWDTAPEDGWEPVLGSPLLRSLARWGIDAGFDLQTIAGLCGQQMSNQNSNSVPATAWTIMDSLTCSDPELLPNLRREAQAALINMNGNATGADGDTDMPFDLQKLLSSPWLQAVYAETLRLRVIFSIVRGAERDTEVDGVRIPRGAIVQAPIPLAHHNQAAWGVEGHPPSEFWPRRHLSRTGTGEKGSLEEFAIGRNRTGYWFPYGGGITMCPGRNFAKQEIIGTLALFLTRFDIEVLGWVVPGVGHGQTVKPSDRRAQNGAGFALCRPDRDLKVRITRKL